MKRILLTIISVALFLTAAAAAVPLPAGPNFLVNQVTELSQSRPAVAQDAGGNFVIAWLDEGLSPAPATIKIRLFTASGAAASDEIVVANLSPFFNSPPRVAVTPLGEIAVVWEDRQVVYLRRFDRLGQAKGDAAAVSHSPYFSSHTPDVGLDDAGNAFVVWAASEIDGDRILLQRLDADDQPLGLLEPINPPAPFLRDTPRLAMNVAGSLLVSWNDGRLVTGDIWARRYDGPSHAWSPAVQINPLTNGVQEGSAPLLFSQGDGAVIYNDFSAQQILVRRLDATGALVGDPIKIGDLDQASPFSPGAATSQDGVTLVTWLKGSQQQPLVHARPFDSSWSPLGEEAVVSSPADDSEYEPAVTTGAAGSFVVAWTSSGPPPPPFSVPSILDGRDGSQLGVFAQRFQTTPIVTPPPACVPTAATLCLLDRFQVRVSWQNGGTMGAGQTVPLTVETGAFWFFDPNNLELMIQVLDTRAENGYFEVHYGAVSNVDFTVTVTNVRTGDERTYHNPGGVFGSVADDQAFAEAPPTPGGVPPPTFPPPPAAGRCTPTATVLCELSRFAVTVDFVDPATGATKPAQAVPVTGSSGAFWFTDILTPELLVKVLDGRGLNHYFWVFSGALTDQAYTLTVTDMVTGTKKVYPNAAGHLGGVADTRAFRARTVPSH
ncbi:MAG TPA: hypothetical protein VIE43_12195 [Thermoanaerobaculia bacterium]|nr:hypothetical protein [Thermoanaerobaculia bacterium]